jgi:starch phosphorylase
MRVFFAGKAHPRDGQGQEILRAVVDLTRRDEFAAACSSSRTTTSSSRARCVQGVDVWLNNPVRMLEASGTSGMKAAANGVLNLSIPDGWWVEGFDGHNGWNVGDGRVWHEPALQDELDSQSIVRLLADEVPAVVLRARRARRPGALARGAAQHNLATIPPVFNTDRMVGEYRDLAYAPMAERWYELVRDGYAPVRGLAAVRERVRKQFGEVKIVDAQVSDLTGPQGRRRGRGARAHRSGRAGARRRAGRARLRPQQGRQRAAQSRSRCGSSRAVRARAACSSSAARSASRARAPSPTDCACAPRARRWRSERRS